MLRRLLKRVFSRGETPRDPSFMRSPSSPQRAHPAPAGGASAAPPEGQPEEEEPLVEVDAEGLTRWSEEGRSFLLLDIRTPGELRQGMLTGARWIPMDEIPRRMDELPRDVPIVVYCAAGARSFGVAHYLRQQGLAEAWSLSGGAGAWAHKGWTMPD